MRRIGSRGLLVLVVVSVFVMPVLVAGWLWTRVQPSDEAAPEEATIDCVPFEPPRTVREINDFVRTQRSSPGFVGADVGVSTRLSDGRSIWAFGDTIRPEEAPGPTMVRNSLMLMGDGCASVYLPADHGPAVPDREDGVGYWPTTIDAIEVSDDLDRVAIGLMRVRTTGEGSWDFENVGSSVARFDVPAGGVPQLVDVTDLGPDLPYQDAPLWGAAVEVTDDWVYIYGTANPGDPYVFGYSLHVARSTVQDYLDVDSWQYWNGYEWTDDRDSAIRLVPAEDGVSRVLSVFEKDGAWYAVSKRNEFLGDELVIWKASAPTGPFVPGPVVAEIPSDSTRLRYMPLAHPDLLPRKGSVVVSWSNNTTLDPERILQQPTLYRPRFIRVDLP